MRVLTCVLFAVLTLSAVAAEVTDCEYEASGSERAVRAELWIQHLDQFAATHPGLTDEQRSIVLAGRELLSGGVLQSLQSSAPKQVEAARRSMLAFEARASQSFSRELYAEAFVRLAERPQRARTSGIQLVSMLKPECFCNPNYNECGGGECFTGGCLVMPDGCGTFGWDICTGLC